MDMPYDYQLVSGALLVAIGILYVLSLMVDRRSPLPGLIVMAIGCGLVYWAWEISEQDLTIYDAPNALFRIIGSILG